MASPPPNGGAGLARRASDGAADPHPTRAELGRAAADRATQLARTMPVPDAPAGRDAQGPDRPTTLSPDAILELDRTSPAERATCRVGRESAGSDPGHAAGITEMFEPRRDNGHGHRIESAEGRPVPLDLPARFTDPRFALLYLSGLPAGAALSAGTELPDGSWLLSAADVAGLTLRLPQPTPGEVVLSARAVVIEDRDGAMSALRQDVVISAHAGARLAAPAAALPEPRRLPLDLAGLLASLGEGARVDALVVEGVPRGASLSSGVFDAELGCWVLRPVDLGALHLVAAGAGTQPIALRIKVIGIDPDSGRARVATHPVMLAGESSDHPAGPPVGGVGFFRPLGARRR